MVEVIKYGLKRRVQCHTCGSILQFEKQDAKTKQVGMNECETFIKCPVCEEDVIIPYNMSK